MPPPFGVCRTESITDNATKIHCMDAEKAENYRAGAMPALVGRLCESHVADYATIFDVLPQLPLKTNDETGRRARGAFSRSRN